jgi:hypothetical protein
MAYQSTNKTATKTKKEPGWKKVPNVKKAAKKNRRALDKVAEKEE